MGTRTALALGLASWLLLPGCLDGQAAARSDAASASPRLLWSEARQAVWHRMVRENHPYAQSVRSNCDRAMRGSPRYGDRGLWCTIWYQWSGNPAAARTAWNQARGTLTTPPGSANEVREYFLEHAIIFDWLRPSLPPSEIAAAVEGLNSWARFALAIGTPQWVGGLRIADTDALIGYYFGLAATDLATRGLPGHEPWLRATQQRPSELRVGGLTPGAERSARSAIRDLLTGPGRGGEWVESSEYNLGTIALLALGVEVVRSAAGPGLFPEADRYLRDAAQVQVASVTPDLGQALQWGDTEHPRGFADRLFRRRTLLGILAGAIPGTEEAARLHDLSRQLVARYGESGYLSAEPWPRYFLLADPWAPSLPWQSGPAAWHAPGMGMAWIRDEGGLFWMAMNPRLGVDHEMQYLADFQLYRNGEWVLTRPLGYAGPAVEGPSANTLLVSGFGAMSRRGPTRFESGPGWWAMTGETSGPRYGEGYWEPPPAFLEQWQRTIVYLRREAVDYVITVDWVRTDDPRSLPRLERYRAPDRGTINGRRGLVEWLVHAPVRPAGDGSRWHWRTPRGQPVTIRALGETPLTAAVINESEFWRGARTFRPGELGWQLRLIPAFTGGRLTLRHVVSVGEGAAEPELSGNTIIVGTTRITVTPDEVSVER